MEIKLVPIESVIPYPKNPRINDNAVEKVKASLKEFGFRQPIVVDEEMVVIAGHTRLKAAYQLGLTEIPVHIALGLSKAQAKAYRLADNRVGQDASWDSTLLNYELNDLIDLKFDLELTGFSKPELQDVLNGQELEEFFERTGDDFDKKTITCPKCNHEFESES